MRLEQHVMSAIDAFDRGNKDEALMQATVAIDATARNLFRKDKIFGSDYKACLRQYWWLIERMIGEGLNLEETKFTHLKLDDGHGKQILNPDLVDIVYHIFRCSHAHAKEVPIEYTLLPAGDGRHTWWIGIADNSIHMPENLIWALLAISVFCKANAGIKTESEHFLAWGSKEVGYTKFLLRDSWGTEDMLKNFFAARLPPLRVKLAGL